MDSELHKRSYEEYQRYCDNSGVEPKPYKEWLSFANLDEVMGTASMRLLNATKLVSGLQNEITHNEKERDSAIKSGWYEKAAKLEVVNSGLKRAIQMIQLGDFDIKQD
jgi:hypothetical protein